MRLVDADALIDIFEDRLEKIRDRYGDYSGEAGVCAGALHLIRVQPTVEPERKTGKWIDDCECSVCHWINEDDGGDTLLTYYNYCPNCGAKMDGGEQE